MLIDRLEAARKPLCQARVNLERAEADLNGVVARISAGEIVSLTVIRTANARVTHARHEVDRVRFATLGVETIGNRAACTNDPDDMIDALKIALERIEDRPASDPNAGLALGPTDCLPRVGSFY